MNSDNRSNNYQPPAAQQAMPASPSEATPPSDPAAATTVGAMNASSEEDCGALVQPHQVDAADDEMDAAIQLPVEDDQGDPDPPMPPALVGEATIPAAATRIGFENASSDGDDGAPVRPTQVGAACHGVDEAVKSSVKEDHGDDDTLLPPSQITALNDGNENTASSAEEGHGGDGSAPVRPALVARAYDEMDAAVKQHIKDARGSGINPPVPPALVARAHDEMDATIKQHIQDAMVSSINPPVPPALVARAYDEMDETIKQHIQDATVSGINPPVPSSIVPGAYDDMDDKIKGHMQQTAAIGIDSPLPPSKNALVQEEMEDDEENSETEIELINSENTPSMPAPILPTPPERDEVNRWLQPPTTSPPVPPSHPINQGQGLSNIRPQQQHQLPIRPTPRSMLPSPEEDESAASLHAPATPREPSVPMLEATLVEDQPEIPVYDAVQVEQKTWLRRNQKYIFGGLGLLLGVGMALGASLNSNAKAKEEENSGGFVVPSTTQPSESSSPSPVPSLRPTFGPSQSLAPSTTASEPPSGIPSPWPSNMPSSSSAPSHLICGKINILADKYPAETMWTISSNVAMDGDFNSKVVAEGSPEEEGHHTKDVCLGMGEYQFTIFDSEGDGICCSYGNGYYNLTFDGMVIAQGGEFKSEETVSFSLPLPTPHPSQSSSPSEKPSSSFKPSESFTPSEIPSLRPSSQPSISSPPSTFWSSLNWNQQGQDINGDTANDLFGTSVAFSADGMTMAVGGPGQWGNSDRSGHVKIYHREGEGLFWEQRGDTLYGKADSDLFGSSLSLSSNGDILTIGAPFNDSIGSNSGQVKVYKWEESSMNYKEIGDALCGKAAGDRFGQSLDLSSDGKTLAVGADQFDTGKPGYAMTYSWDEVASKYMQQGEAIKGDAAGDWFGYSVTLSGDGKKLAIGAPKNNDNSGQVKVFAWSEVASTYEQLGDSIAGDAALNSLGSSVSLSENGEMLATGAPYNDANSFNSGQVKIFAWDVATLNFEQLGESLFGKADWDQFGGSVALSSDGKTLAIGAEQQIPGKPGFVEVYSWDEIASAFKQLGKSLNGKEAYDGFGSAVALSGNGKVLVVGASTNDENGNMSGEVKFFGIEL